MIGTWAQAHSYWRSILRAAPSHRRVMVVSLAISLLASIDYGVRPADAHAGYARSEPMAGATIAPSDFVLKIWFAEELLSRSTVTVVDKDGMRVDLGDGRVDLDDPDRRLMLVSVPRLATGEYTVRWITVSSEDGHAYSGSFTFGVGMTPRQPWSRVGSWNDSRLMSSEPFTVQGPWRIRWRLASVDEPLYLMIEEGDYVVPVLIVGQIGATDGVIYRERGGTFRLMFHNTVPYDVIVEDFATTSE